MAQAALKHDHHDHGGGGGGHSGMHHPPIYYIKIWAILLGLLVVSILGPMLGHKILTLITAFGIAIVKALMVAAFFMHLNIEKRYVWYMLFGMLAMVTLFFYAVAPDVNQVVGRNWENRAAISLIEEKAKHAGEGGEHGEHGGHHDEAGAKEH